MFQASGVHRIGAKPQHYEGEGPDTWHRVVWIDAEGAFRWEAGETASQTR
jgi:hypothetical protein